MATRDKNLQQLQDAVRLGFSGMHSIANSLIRALAAAQPEVVREVDAALATGAILRLHFDVGAQRPLGLWLTVVMPDDTEVELLCLLGADGAAGSSLTH